MGWQHPRGKSRQTDAAFAHAASFECLIEPWQVVEIRSAVEGLGERIVVQRGDTVRKGQMLVELQSAAKRSAVDAGPSSIRVEFDFELTMS